MLFISLFRILASRICELDKAVQSPTMKLLEGYSNADIDIKCKLCNYLNNKLCK